MKKSILPSAALVTRSAVVLLGLALFFEQLGALRLLHLDGAGGRVMMTPVYWVSLLAPVFFLTALWSAARVFGRIERGDDFGPAMVCGLKEIGWCLMLGAWAAIVAQPALIFLIGNGFRELRGVRFDLNVENLTLALVGLVFVVLAREGQKLKTKLDEFV